MKSWKTNSLHNRRFRIHFARRRWRRRSNNVRHDKDRRDNVKLRPSLARAARQGIMDLLSNPSIRGLVWRDLAHGRRGHLRLLGRRRVVWRGSAAAADAWRAGAAASRWGSRWCFNDDSKPRRCHTMRGRRLRHGCCCNKTQAWRRDRHCRTLRQRRGRGAPHVRWRHMQDACMHATLCNQTGRWVLG